MSRKYNRTRENTFTSVCQQMHTLASACRDWLSINRQLYTEPRHLDCPAMRSTRLACMLPGSHEAGPQSTLQLVVLPAEFDALRYHGTDRTCWRLMVYSWLGADTTRRLAAHLRAQRLLPSPSTVLLVTADGCEPLSI